MKKVIILLIFMLSILVSCGNKTDDKSLDSEEADVVLDVYNYANDFDMENTAECFVETSKEYLLNNTTWIEKFMSMITNDGDIKNVEIVDVRDETAKKKWVRVKKTFNNGEIEREAMVIVKEKDKWKLTKENYGQTFDYLPEPDNLEGVWQNSDKFTVKLEKDGNKWKAYGYGVEIEFVNNKLDISGDTFLEDGSYSKSDDGNLIEGEWSFGEYKLVVKKVNDSYILYQQDYDRTSKRKVIFNIMYIMVADDGKYFMDLSERETFDSEDDFLKWLDSNEEELASPGKVSDLSGETFEWDEKLKALIDEHGNDGIGGDIFSLKYEEDEKSFYDATKIED